MKVRIAELAGTLWHVFLLLCAVFIPFPFTVFSFQETFSNFCFGGITALISKHILGVEPALAEITSDSVLLYALVLILFLVSMLLSIVLTYIAKWQQNRNAFCTLIKKFLSYYLALQLIIYGAEKVFKTQFYSPEPNILYTPFGNLDKDILFWSAMGTSRLYNVLMGVVEIVPGLLILFRKTRTPGLLIALAVLLNVVIINFGFDISVKVYSVFLLALSLFLLGPQARRLYDFLMKQKTGELATEPPTFLFFEKPFVRGVLKSLVICLVSLEVFYSYWNTKEQVPRPFFHGAYEVIRGNDTISANDPRIKRFFIHRDGYLIFQTEKDEMIDFKFMVNTVTSQFILIDYNLKETLCRYSYNEKEGLIELQSPFANKQQMLRAKTIDWKKLPALQDGFHWTLEGAAK